MMPMDRSLVKVAVLCGGDSPEREVSLRSGQGVHAALKRRGFSAALIEIDSYDGLPQRLSPFPVVFNILHGGAGEDGTVQLLLELLGKSYVGSGPLACALAMDKHATHQLLSAKGLPVPDWLTYPGEGLESFLARAAELGFPLVIKPRDQGSSVGLFLVHDRGELASRAQEVLEKFGSLLIEKYIAGRELTCALLEGDSGVEALPLVELRPKRGALFDWGAKYSPGACEFICPAELPAGEAARAAEVSKQAFMALGCRDFARADLRLAPDGTPFVLEVNTLPGLTELSTFPRAAAAADIPYDGLVSRLVDRALARLPIPDPTG
ncbi:TPA: D-alanine--D-alanine ligase [Candidatus Bipolaricaulota bacterium]|nr:D-alanine--D-alanine ligase [Candidatus Bipolaricaulota bacterium]